MAVRKKNLTWGGKRKGAGRPIGSGSGRGPNARYNRVAVMLTDKEWTKLDNLAAQSALPIATAAYKIVARSLKRLA